MKITIAGSGAMGCRFGAALSAAGHDVLLLDGWAEHVAAINEAGLRVTDGTGTQALPVPAVLFAPPARPPAPPAPPPGGRPRAPPPAPLGPPPARTIRRPAPRAPVTACPEPPATQSRPGPAQPGRPTSPLARPTW